MNTYITNELYREGCRCQRLFWLDINNNATYSVHNPELSLLAENYIPGGQTVLETEPEERALATCRLATSGETLIKRPAFLMGKVFAEASVLHLTGNETHIYFTFPAAHIRRAFFREAAMICAAAEKTGFYNIRVFLLLPNKEFVRHGKISPKEFFILHDMTADAVNFRDKAYIQCKVMEHTAVMWDEPEASIHQGCFSPDTCKYFDHCTAHLPHPNVFKIARLSQNTKLKLYNEGNYAYESLRDDPRLTDAQRKQIKMTLSKARPLVKKKELREYLSTLWYPMCFLDFESWQSPVPPSDNMHPFEQVAFQYSLHIKESEDAPLIHKEFLAHGEADPRKALAEQLASDIPDGSCVLAYNKQFESMVISGLAEAFPHLSQKLCTVRDNIRDLMVPFQKKYYYDRRMEGSFSIKAVLPALYPDAPELSYSNLEGIHNGSQAMLSYSTLASLPPDEAEEVRQRLLKYCSLDTFGMVKILEKLYAAVE
ncbi:MAG: DUF2779 domain-containing protein [Clostridia bacterium]|nr:DUF2779 domain-containing protein [Clostridia bacterium]